VGLRTVVVVALAAWAGWLLFRGVMRRRVPWIGLAALAVPLLFLGYGERQWVNAEHAFTTASRVVAPNGPGIRCQRLGDTFTYAGAELGHVDWNADGGPTGPAMISYETCGHLTDYWKADAVGKAVPTFDEIVAVHVLSHESVHMAGEHNEALTDCRAMQLDTQVAEALGATPSSAHTLAAAYYAQVYPQMPSAYTNPGCHAGGPLDTSPGDGVWP
jgi:hypothetical protein